MIHITYPIILLIIPIILWIWYTYFREKIWINHPNTIIANFLINTKYIKILWIIRTIIVIFIWLLLSWAHIQYTTTIKEKKTHDIMIILDISLSMLAEDMSPNRIEVAKNVIKNFISTRNDDQVGLIIFAGKPFVLMPFSNDYSGIKNIISWITPYLIRQDLPWLSGTNIGDALVLGNMSFSWRNSPHKSIILITDGRANLWISPETASYESQKQNINIYTIGIWNKNGWILSYTNTYWEKTYFYDEKWNKLSSDIDEAMLKNISNIANWEYFHAENKINLDTIFESINKTLINTYDTKLNHISLNMYLPLLILIWIGIALERLLLSRIMWKYHL